MFTNILVALKENQPHEPLLELAKKAGPSPARVHLVTLVRVGTEDDEIQRLRRTERSLEEQAKMLTGEGYETTWEASIVAVSAAVDLVRIAATRESDLMVIGLAKRTRVGKALMGSDAQRIMLSAECPVLVRQLHGM
ncbi:Universal stress protein family protein [Blastococcus aggregatus]|uniref:Universal stress protein family protein n=1 Tax=Blastococcus aggregatus TaxID=38502 RepID=A0A285V622_9ACTN|nr:universal stress protein [Blastococcus aggregatus]SOC49509.1 Universal stress protein family protein [Blastococcus aggregatus]